MLLDYVFMGPLQMGIQGAALATGLGPVSYTHLDVYKRQAFVVTRE